jgi:hypothetical protein
MVLIACFFAAAVDGVVASARQPANTFDVTPGMSIRLTGPLPEKVAGPSELTHTGDPNALHLSIEAVGSGFWLGGEMWRGVLTVDPQSPPGELSFRVLPKDREYPVPPPAFRIIVHKDAQSLQQAEKSLIARYCGISPWALAALSVPFIIAALGAVYYLSNRMEQFMAMEGKAVIYMVREGDSGTEIAFGLGARHGVRPGDRLTLLDEQEVALCDIEAWKVSETDSIALLKTCTGVTAGCIVRRRPA